MPFWTYPAGDRLLVDASLWSAKLAALGADVTRMTAAGVDLFHIDVSDASMAPDLLFFPDLVAALREFTSLPLHAHLMVTDPVPTARRFAAAGADLISVHVEAGNQAVAAVSEIGAAGKAAGLAVSLSTDLTTVLPLLPQLDAIVMVGTPLGSKGVPASPQAVQRVADMRRLVAEHAPDRDIRILADGGIRADTVPQLAAAGAQGVVAGSLLFTADDHADMVSRLHRTGHPR